MIQAKDIWAGKERTIWAICRRDRPIFEDDLFDDVSKVDKDEFEAFYKRLSDYVRPIRDKRLQTPIQGYSNLYEMKPYGYRLFYFYGNDGNDVYITSGCKKKNRKENQNQYRRAHNIRLEFLRED